MSGKEKKPSILIIGSGAFGISTAYHLAKRGYSDITCIDRQPRPSVDSAGYDLNKMVRAEYDEPLYTALALEALDAWRKPEWEGIFHETGRISTAQGSQQLEKHFRDSYDNLERLGHAKTLKFVQGRDQITQLVPQLQNALHVERWKGLFNTEAGWVHAKKALEKWAAEAHQLGVKFVSGPQGTMTGLGTDQHGALAGIHTASGEILRADKYILCPGAASPEVLPELSRQLWSKCWALAHIQLTEAEAAEWKGIPAIDHFELGYTFEPDPETRRMKICNDNAGYQYRVGSYTDKAGNRTCFSIPRYASAHPEDGIPMEAEAAMMRFIDGVMPQFSGRPLLDARLCWCTDTVDGHWLIDRHPVHGDLLLATGGSGHGFKMFPIIGGYIADALEGSPRGLKKEWRYGSRKPKPISIRPDAEVKDLRDVLGQ